MWIIHSPRGLPLMPSMRCPNSHVFKLQAMLEQEEAMLQALQMSSQMHCIPFCIPLLAGMNAAPKQIRHVPLPNPSHDYATYIRLTNLMCPLAPTSYSPRDACTRTRLMHVLRTSLIRPPVLGDGTVPADRCRGGCQVRAGTGKGLGLGLRTERVCGYRETGKWKRDTMVQDTAA